MRPCWPRTARLPIRYTLDLSSLTSGMFFERLNSPCFILTGYYRHLEGASGILAVVKAILMIKKGIILPTAGFEQMNVKIEGRDRLKVAGSPIDWPENEPRRVIVTNFGG